MSSINDVSALGALLSLMLTQTKSVEQSPKVESFSGVKNDDSETAFSYLGNTTESASPKQPQSRLIWRYRVQSEARRILNRHQTFKPHRISSCMRYMRQGVDRVALQKHEHKPKARFGGLMKCDSVWCCPVCSSIITERRKIELQLAVAAAKSLGLELFMVTYTLQHSISDPLKLNLQILLGASRAIKSGKNALVLKKKYGIRGSIKALEVTHGVSGWHPHLHEILFLSAECVDRYTRIDLENSLRDRWQYQVKRLGGSLIREIGCKVDKGDSYVAEYVAKFGHEPIEQRWSLEAEITKSPSKVARTKDGRTPFALLEDSMNGDSAAAGLFKEYVDAFKGRAQLFWSPGLAELLEVDVKTDVEANEEAESLAWFTLAFIERDDWSLILRNERRGELIEVAQSGEIEKVREFILSLYEQEIKF